MKKFLAYTLLIVTAAALVALGVGGLGLMVHEALLGNEEAIFMLQTGGIAVGTVLLFIALTWAIQEIP